MSVSKKYSHDEWQTIATIPQAIGAVMASASYSGLIGSGKEIFENVRSIMDAKQQYPNNPLIQEIVPEKSERSDIMAKAKEQREFLMKRIKDNNITSSDALKQFVIDNCSKTIELLEEKESEDVVSEYKKWVLDIADNVAHAAKEGDFLGFGGEQFSDKEQELYSEIKSILN